MATTQENPHPDDLDDYVAESDENLSAARRLLLDLETFPELAAISRDKIDSLFRYFHTIKGLSGMVGARAAEGIAHQLETYLGSIRKGQRSLSAPGVDILLDGIGFLETAIAAFRESRPEPDTSPLIARIATFLPERIPDSKVMVPPSDNPPEPPNLGSLSTDQQARLEAAVARGDRPWRITFVPSADFATRGVNVNSVRKRLQAAGEILHAEPAAIPGGGVQFRFVLIASHETEMKGWDADGLTVEPYVPPTRAAETASPQAGVTLVSPNLVRVDLGRLDDLMRAVGEMVQSRARLENDLARVTQYLPSRERRRLEETAQLIERQLRDLREGVMRVRMVPIRDLFARMRLVVRDLTRETGKDIELIVAGEDTEIDKFVVERMADPLLHLVRNAVSHGLEMPSHRVTAGKSPRGRLTLRAAAIGGTITVEVEDDGRGVQVEEVFAHARTIGLVPQDAPIDPTAVLDLICAPGFSTRDEADLSSGRGVGMDVARRSVERLGGSLAMDSHKGAGTRITARLPLTLVIADVLTVSVGNQTYAIPQTAVREVVPVEPSSTTILENNELIRYHGGVLPLLRLNDVFHAPSWVGPFVALVIGEGSATVAIAADRAIGLREVVVRPMADFLIQVPGIGGATELGDGRPILILDPAGLARFARRRTARSYAQAGE